MTKTTNMRAEIADLAVRFHEAGIPVEDIAQEMLATGAARAAVVQARHRLG